jgi:hypothetical protein
MLDIPRLPVTMGEEELILWYETETGARFDDVRDFQSYDQYRSDVLGSAKGLKSREYIGGAGVTDRGIDELAQQLPGVKEDLGSVAGKVVFLGNGLSDVPLIVSQRYARGSVKTSPVVVDLFLNSDLKNDLERVVEESKKRGIEIPRSLENYYRKVRLLDVEIQEGNLANVQYHVGSGNVPSELTNADLIINSNGPDVTSIHEQLSMLAVGGLLYVSYPIEGNHIDFEITPLYMKGLDYSTATKIKRLK